MSEATDGFSAIINALPIVNFDLVRDASGFCQTTASVIGPWERGLNLGRSQSRFTTEDLPQAGSCEKDCGRTAGRVRRDQVKPSRREIVASHTRAQEDPGLQAHALLEDDGWHRGSSRCCQFAQSQALGGDLTGLAASGARTSSAAVGDLRIGNEHLATTTAVAPGRGREENEKRRATGTRRRKKEEALFHQAPEENPMEANEISNRPYSLHVHSFADPEPAPWERYMNLAHICRIGWASFDRPDHSSQQKLPG
jgi:hypothetical protein